MAAEDFIGTNLGSAISLGQETVNTTVSFTAGLTHEVNPLTSTEFVMATLEYDELHEVVDGTIGGSSSTPTFATESAVSPYVLPVANTMLVPCTGGVSEADVVFDLETNTATHTASAIVKVVPGENTIMISQFWG